MKIIDSVIWDNVLIEENCEIKCSLICSGAIIRKNSIVSNGCLISNQVIMKENTKLPEFSIASLFKMENGKPKELDGSSSQYFEKGDIFDISTLSNLKPYERFNSEFKVSEEDLEDSESLTENSSEADDLEPNNEFLKEVIETIQRVHTKESTIKTVIFEMNNLKYGENKGFADCIKAFMPEILGELLKIEQNASPEITTTKIKGLIEFWSPLMSDYSHATEDAVLLINQMEDFCNKNSRFKSSFNVMLQVIIYT